ncbi:Protein kinase-like domain superfamily [Sesbania bispinosa]|nr:Protein kinase-like domain superfamily [Sesbania bispinosa]
MQPHAPKSNRVELTRISVAWILVSSPWQSLFSEKPQPTNNSFHGKIPQELGRLSQLQYLYLSDNSFTGEIPTNLTSCSYLKDLVLNGNNLIGKIPIGIGSLAKLQILWVAKNNLTGGIPPFIGNLSSLTILRVVYQVLWAICPPNQPTISWGNHLLGKIPAELGNLINLTLLSMEINHFEGTIPTAFGKFQNMQYLGQNMLEGNIPPSIGNCQKLQYLNLSHNNLRGTIPSKANSINWLDLSENHLSGNIPGNLGECTSLEYLYLQGNSFHGIMPSSLASLKGLQRLDLSRNRLFGSIPKEGVFQNASKLAVAGNKNLCGGILSCIYHHALAKSMEWVLRWSIEGDIYSFGILVLEMLTGRRPTDELFEDGHNIHNHVKLSIPNQLLQIVDPVHSPPMD